VLYGRKLTHEAEETEDSFSDAAGITPVEAKPEKA